VVRRLTLDEEIEGSNPSQAAIPIQLEPICLPLIFQVEWHGITALEWLF
jgi:hypothetical protein